MEKIASVYARLAARYKICNKNRFLDRPKCSRSFSQWTPNIKTQVSVEKNSYITPSRTIVQQYHGCASCHKVFSHKSVKLNKRFFSKENSGIDSEELMKVTEELLKQKTLFTRSLDDPSSVKDDEINSNRFEDNSMNVLSSECDINEEVDYKIDDACNELEQSRKSTLLNTNSKGISKSTETHGASTYDSDSDEIPSSDSDSSDESSSDSDSDSSGTDIDGDSTDAEGGINPRLNRMSTDGESLADGLLGIDDIKIGFTAEEMIDHINDTIDNVDEDFISDSDGDSFMNVADGDPDETVENKHATNNNSVDERVSDMSYASAPSRHFDESGVVSLIDMNKGRSKGRDWSIEEIEDFVNITAEEEEESSWQPPISLERGKEGVFDVEDLVTLIKDENLQDIMALRIPPEKHFGDYMVIGTAKSFRHLTAVAENINWIYKRRKGELERFTKLEGKEDNSGWIAMDLGNIILHIFLEEERQIYDLETLWTVGAQYDDKCLEQDDPYALSVDEHPWLKELEDKQTTGSDVKDVKDVKDGPVTLLLP